MARPTDPIVVWAHDDVILPNTGKQNKSRPIDDLLAKGYDKNQKPAAEEFNYILNMSSGWIDWIVNEKFPELEEDITRRLRELEERINGELEIIRGDIDQLNNDLSTLRRYVDQELTKVRNEISVVDNKVTQLRQDMDLAISQLNGRIDAIEPFLVPIGTVVPWPGQTPPKGWLECNGQVFNTTNNPKMYGVLGRNTVPDYRGLFLRGWSHGSGAFDPDANRGLGSVQGDAIRNITGYFPADIGQSSWIGRYVGGAFYDNGALTSGDTGGQSNEVRKYVFDASRVVPVAAENRPKNIAVMYIIKSDQAISPGTNSPTGIVVSPDSITNRVGYTVKATANVLPANLASQYPITWTSQNTGVATVDGSGNIRLVGPGETTIIASISTGMNVQISVTSYSVMTSITIGDPGNIQVDESAILQVTKNPAGATEPLQFLSNNSGVATVNDSGYVTGVAPGTVTITVRGTLSGVSATRSITIVPQAVVPVLEDIKLGVQQRGDPLQAPPGCVVTYVRQAESAEYIEYKALLKQINGEWVIVEG